jgi:hypothetical protein
MGQRAQTDPANARSRIALTDIHEARRVADESIDKLLTQHQTAGPGSDSVSDAAQDAHSAVLMLYNRLRPYLPQVPYYWEQVALYEEVVTDENGEPKTDEDGEGVTKGLYGLNSLDEFRFASRAEATREERVGEPDQESVEEHAVRLPPKIALAAYDALNAAIVDMEFAAEVGGDVEEVDIDDEEAEDQSSFGETPEFET